MVTELWRNIVMSNAIYIPSVDAKDLYLSNPLPLRVRSSLQK